jgi:hypothetical protein
MATSHVLIVFFVMDLNVQGLSSFCNRKEHNLVVLFEIDS